MGGFDAFISYSHSADGELAPALQNGLQRLAKPWNRRRALEVFRDQTGLAVTPHLWGSITAALDTTRWFVLLASPESAHSEWVGKEIEHWLQRPLGRDHILPVVTGGVWEWSDTGGFTSDSSAVHPALRDAFTEEPLYLDFTWAKTASDLDLANARFREAVAAVAAPIHGVAKDELVGEDVHQFKLARRFRRAAEVGLATLAVVAAIASVMALKQRDTAVERKQQAEASAAQSRSRELATLARSTMDDDPMLAALLAVEANYPNGAVTPIDNADARITLGMATRRQQWATFTRVGPRITAQATHLLQADTKYLATIDYSTCTCTVSWWDATTGDRVTSPATAAEEAKLTAPFGLNQAAPNGGGAQTAPPSFGDFPITEPFTVDATTDLLVGTDSATGDLVVQPNAGGEVVSRLVRPPGVELAFVVSLPSGQVVAITTTGDLYGWSLMTGGPAQRIAYSTNARSLGVAGPNRIVVEAGDRVGGAVDGSLIGCARVCFDTSALLTDVANTELPSASAATRIDVVDITDLASPRVVASLAGAAPTVFGSYATAPATDSGPHYLAARGVQADVLGDASVFVWDLETNELVATIPSLFATDLRWLDGTTLAVLSTRGLEEFRLQVPPIAREPVSDLAISADGRVVGTLPGTGPGPPSRYARPSGTTEPPPPELLGPMPGNLALIADGRAAAYVREVSGSTCLPLGPTCPPRLTAVDVVALDTAAPLASFASGSAAAFDSTGQRLAVGRTGAIDIVDTSTWRVVRAVKVPNVAPSQIVWTPDGRDLLVRGTDYSYNSVTRSVDVASGRSTAVTRDDAVAIAIAANGRTIATAGKAGIVELWSRDASGKVGSKRLSSMFADAQPVITLSFSPDGTRLATSGNSVSAIWDVTNRSLPRRLELLTALPALERAHVNEDAFVLQSGGAEAARWGLVAFNPDGKSIMLAGPSGAVELADYDPKLVCTLAGTEDLIAAEHALGAKSACLRVPGLRAPAG